MYSTSSPMDFLAVGIGFFLFYMIFICGIFVAFALYYKTIIDTMSLVRPENRLTGTGNIMLNIIPIFNMAYGFIVYPKICDSIKQEYSELGLQPDGDFGKGLAITLQALSLTMMIPFINFLTSIGCLVIWIILWAKLSGYKTELQKHNGASFNEKPTLTASTDLLD